jgi:hypothetical protein
MAATDLAIINAALTRTGNQTITSLDDAVIGAQIATANYEELVKAELSANPWKSATKTEVLDIQMDGDDPVAAPDPWLYVYDLPDDLVSLRTIAVAGMPIDYAVMGSTILCNVLSDDTTDVVAHYVWRVGVALWPPWFVESVTQRLEALFLRAIGERYEEAEARDKSADMQFSVARNRDAQMQTPRDPYRSATLAARRGAVLPWSWPWDPWGWHG